MSKAPRGIRNNNPGNIRWGSNWSGLDDKGKEKDREFCVFIDPKWGIRALMKLIINYGRLYNLFTVRGIIARYAPSNENNTEAYITHVARLMGVCAEEELNFLEYKNAKAIVKAIITHENGIQPYDDKVIDEGLTLAGVVCCG